MVIRYLIEKEFKQIFRNKFLPKLFVMLPTVMLLIMPWAANQEINGLAVSIVDDEHSSLSGKLIEKIGASPYFTISKSEAIYEEALHDVESDKADVIVEIPQDFEKSLESGKPAEIFIAANAVNGVKSGLGSSYLSSIVADFSAELRKKRGENFGAVRRQNFSVTPRFAFNPHLDYKVFMVPALMVMMLTLLSGFLPALNIVSEKEKGTMEQMNVTPVGKIPFILSKLIPYWAVGFFVLSYSILLAKLAYGLSPEGSLLTIYAFASVYILVVSGLGLVISNNSATMQQALFIMFFFLMVFILMSSLFTPIDSMPGWAQTITKFNPLRYFIEVMRMMYLKGSSFADLIPNFRMLCIFALVLDGWACLSYKKSA